MSDKADSTASLAPSVASAMSTDPGKPPAPPEVSAETAAAADVEKDKGNMLFKKGNFAAAVAQYKKAIDLNPRLIPAHTNLSFCHLKLEEFGACIAVASEAIAIDPNCAKAYYRRACANFMLARLKDANRDFAQTVRLCPTDPDAVKKAEECKRQLKRQQFLSALAADDPVPMWQKIAKVIDSWEKPGSSYAGPTFDIAKPPDEAYAAGAMQHFFNERTLHRVHAFSILLHARAFLSTQPNVVPITVPADAQINVCGDTHGQFYDLRHIFEQKGTPSVTNRYLFNGDFVDRGSFSCEVAFTMLCWKLALPNHFFISRGNHESRDQNKIFGFEGEVKAKYSDTLFELFVETFREMPLAHVINDKVFVVHGGLFSEDGVTIDALQKLDRRHDNADNGLMAEMLWSDPAENPFQIGRSASKRGIGVEFGRNVTEDFLSTNQLELVVRSHQVRDEGYTVEHGGKLITVFSAPNYCDSLGNKAAVISFSGKDMSYKTWQFSAQKHPDVQPMQYSRLPMMMMR
eukprot:TRINITY_DN3427_c0_g2_i1.p1 TRINITY_DN3427_c0_g2~~TRINITY_DN3427_c0_g2_i1.p1  ORF type:complete len:546 (-),score=145.15 TRINITY_DN3427_c0_g2_i1:223-1773(-)